MLGRDQFRKTMALLLPALATTLIAADLADAAAVIKIKKSDAICIQNYPGFEGYVVCQYYMVIDGTKFVDGEWVDKQKTMAKTELWRGGTFLPDDDDPDSFDEYQFDGDLVDKETITSSYNECAHMVVSEVDPGLSADDNIITCKVMVKVTHTGDGTVIFIHNKGENCPEDSSPQALEVFGSSVESAPEESQPSASAEVFSVQGGGEVIRFDGCWDLYGNPVEDVSASKGFVYCDYGIDSELTSNGGTATWHRFGKREIHLDGKFLGKYNMGWKIENTRNSEVQWLAYAQVTPEGNIEYCTWRGTLANGEWRSYDHSCEIVVDLSGAVSPSAHGASDAVALDEFVTALTEEYEAAYLAGESESELESLEKVLTLLIQARDSPMSAQVEDVGAVADATGKADASAALQGAGKSTPK